MENYSERVKDIKREILGEIREILPDGKVHKFEKTIYVHYVSGEIVTTEICFEVRNDNGIISLKVAPEDSVIYEIDGYVNGEEIFGFEPNSLIDILQNLRIEIRAEKIAKIREIVERNGEIIFDGNFAFDGFDGREYLENCYLFGLAIENGELIIRNSTKFNEEIYNDKEDFLPDDELDKILEYVKNEVENFSLTDEQNAAIDEFIETYKKLAELNITTLWDFTSDQCRFLNNRGKDINVDCKNIPDGAIDITDYATRTYNFADRVYDPTLDAIYVMQ